MKNNFEVFILNSDLKQIALKGTEGFSKVPLFLLVFQKRPWREISSL